MKLSERSRLIIKILIPVALGIGVTVWLFGNEFNARTLRQIEFTQAIWIGIVLAAIATFFRDFGLAWRFRAISDCRLRWKQSAKITALCEFTSAITPTSAGGSALSMIFLQREGINFGRATSITLITLFLDELFFTVFSPLAILIIAPGTVFSFADSSAATDLRATFWIVYGIICLITILLFTGIFIAPQIISRFIVKIFSLPILRRWHDKAVKTGDDLITASAEVRHKPLKWWIRPAAATVVSWTGRFLTVNALIWGVAPDACQATIFSRQIVIWGLLTFTPTPGGSGISEYLFKTYYSDMLFGSLLMAVALTWRIFTYYIYLLAGFFMIPTFLKKHPKNYETK